METRHLNAGLPTMERVRILMEAMTLEEKVAQLGSVKISDLLKDRQLQADRLRALLCCGIGQLTRPAGGAYGVRDIEPEEAVGYVNAVQRHLLEETRLRIPAMIHEECLAGLMARRATSFPGPLGMASAWRPETIRRVAETIRRQMRALGAHHGLAPVLDVCYDARWGRAEETYGEDPCLVAACGVACVQGLQGDDLRDGIAATGKHFAAHGFPEGGRNHGSVHVAERELREVFLYPFEACVRLAGLATVMNAYHEIDGVPCVASKRLLTGILRGEWGFEGIVPSDYESIALLVSRHFTARDWQDAARQGLEAGVDIELPNTHCFGAPLLEAVKQGAVSIDTIDAAVGRVLRMKFMLGLFDRPVTADPAAARAALDTSEDRRLALEAARESLVLLKNDANALPLRRQLRRLAVIGPAAGDPTMLFSGYTYTNHLAYPAPMVPAASLADALREKLPGCEILCEPGCPADGDNREGFPAAVAAAAQADAVVLAVGEKSGFGDRGMTGEGRDRHAIALPGAQEELVLAVAATGKPAVVVLVNGRPLDLARITERVPAIIEAWFPGEEGGRAIADALFGDFNPGGKLPISFPKHAGQIPVHYHRRPCNFKPYVGLDSQPLYPFGHGLSYTRFEHRDLAISPASVAAGKSVRVAVTVENAGPVAGTEVVQLYVRDPLASVSRPPKLLKGFCRVALAPGEMRRVTFSLPTELLAFYDERMRLAMEPGTIEVMVGGSSEDIRIRGRFEIAGPARLVRKRRAFFSRAAAGPVLKSPGPSGSMRSLVQEPGATPGE